MSPGVKETAVVFNNWVYDSKVKMFLAWTYPAEDVGKAVPEDRAKFDRNN